MWHCLDIKPGQLSGFCIKAGLCRECSGIISGGNDGMILLQLLSDY